MEALAILGIAACVAFVVKRDAKEYGPGCAGLLVALFVAVVFVTVVGMLAAKGKLP